MSNNEFCNELGFSTDLKKEICEKVRHITAKACKVDDDTISPYDDTNVLSKKMFDGWDRASFVMDLEEALRCELTELDLPNFTLERCFFFFQRNGPSNYGEWVKKVVEMASPLVEWKRSHTPLLKVWGTDRQS